MRNADSGFSCSPKPLLKLNRTQKILTMPKIINVFVVLDNMGLKVSRNVTEIIVFQVKTLINDLPKTNTVIQLLLHLL